MHYKQASTLCVVQLVPLRGLSSVTLAQCQALRAEAGRLSDRFGATASSDAGARMVDVCK